MRNLGHYLSLLLVAACLFSASQTMAEDKSKTTALAKQAGGYSNITNEQLKNFIEDDVLVVDIRREEEWKHTGIIPGSKTITFFDNQGRIDPNFLPNFTAIAKKDQPVILICRTGARTKVASQAIAQQLGYKQVINVTHGIMSWIAEKRPINQYGK